MARVEMKFLYEYSNTRREIPYLQGYKHNSLLLTRKFNFILMNENKRIDNPRRKIVNCVGAKAQNEKMC